MKFKPAEEDYNFLQQVIQFEKAITIPGIASTRCWRCRVCGSHFYSGDAKQFELALETHAAASPSCFSLVIPVCEEPA